MNKENLFIIALVGAGYLYFNQAPAENFFFVPGHGDVAESSLPALGYVKFNGRWFKYTDLQAAALANGITTGNVDINTTQGLNLFLTLLAAGTGLATTIINNTAAQKDALIEQILTKYTLPVSLSYDVHFPFTETQLEALTIAKLNQILGGNFTINGISSRALTTAECRDGKYSDSRKGGVCSYHGGIRERASWASNL